MHTLIVGDEMRSCRRGSAAIEFALVAPVLIAIVFGTLEWGWLWSRKALATYAVEEGVRMAAGVGSQGAPDVAAHDFAVETLLAVGLDPSSAVVTATYDGLVPGQLRLDIVLPYAPITGLLPVPNQITASQIAVITF
jgi:Flp pilus assembly protein TadG